MGRLIYLTLTSLDGFIGDGDYSWSVPDEEVMAALIADLAKVGTYVYGRRTYETMAVWEADPAWAAQSPGGREVRFDVAGGGQGRVLLDVGAGVDEPHPVGTAVRRAGGGRDQGGEPW